MRFSTTLFTYQLYLIDCFLSSFFDGGEVLPINLSKVTISNFPDPVTTFPNSLDLKNRAVLFDKQNLAIPMEKNDHKIMDELLNFYKKSKLLKLNIMKNCFSKIKIFATIFFFLIALSNSFSQNLSEEKQGIRKTTLKNQPDLHPEEFILDNYMSEDIIKEMEVTNPERLKTFRDFEKEYLNISQKAKKTFAINHLIKIYLSDKMAFKNLVKTVE